MSDKCALIVEVQRNAANARLVVNCILKLLGLGSCYSCMCSVCVVTFVDDQTR